MTFCQPFGLIITGRRNSTFQLKLLKFPRWDSLVKQEIQLFICPALCLGHPEEGPNEADAR